MFLPNVHHSDAARSGAGFVDEAVYPARKLSELREIALLFAADVVDHQLEQYLGCHGLAQSFGARNESWCA